MNEKQLMIIALISSLLGILLILLASELTEISLIRISEINKDMLGREVKVQGQIISIKETPGLYILKIKDDYAIEAVLFKEEKLQFSEGDSIEIQGEIVEYKGRLEIQINQLKKL